MWFRTDKAIFSKDEVIALKFTHETESAVAVIAVYLRGGATLNFKDEDAKNIWQAWKPENTEKTVNV